MNNHLDIFQIVHPCFYIGDTKSVISNAHITDTKENNYDGIDTQKPVNYPALLQSLSPYIKIHDIAKLLLVSKQVRLSIVESDFLINTNKEEFIMNAMKHNCSNCIKQLYDNNIESVFLLIRASCKMGFAKISNIVCADNILGQIPKTNVILEDCEDDSIKFVHECILYALKHNQEISFHLLEFITQMFSIKHIDTLKILCQSTNCIIIINIINKFNLGGKVCMNMRSLKIMLPHLCEYSMLDAIKNGMKAITIDDYDYLMEFIENSINVYDHCVSSLLLNTFLIYHKKGSKNNEKIVKWIMLVEDINLIRSALNLYSIPASEKIPMVSKAYKYNMSEKLTFLEDTKEWNKLSIEEAIKNDGGEIYTSKLYFSELVQIITNIDNKYIKSKLIYKFNNNEYVSWIKNDDEFKMFENIIKWVITEINDPAMIEHLMQLKCLINRLKILLIPKIYQYKMRIPVYFLDDTRDLNILSINESNKNSGNKIYTSKLTNNEIITFIIKCNNIKTRKRLIHNLKSGTSPCHSTINRTEYTVEKNVLPVHYKNDDHIVDKYEDTKQQFICKVKIPDYIMGPNYIELLLTVDPLCYYVIIDKIIHLLTNTKWNNIEDSLDTIMILINHQNFNNIASEKVINLLKLYLMYDHIVDAIIKNHNIFYK